MKMIVRLVLAIVFFGSAGATLLIGVVPASATIITFNFSATTTSINDPTNILQGSLNIGDTVFGSYTFDGLAVDANPTSSVGSYQIQSGGIVAGNQNIISSSPSDTSVFNDIPFGSNNADTYQVTIRDFAGTNNNSFDFTLFDLTGTAVSSDALLLSPPNLSDFLNQHSGIWRRFDSNQMVVLASANFDITSITMASPIPEPSTLALFAIGLIVLGLMSRRRGRRDQAFS